MINQNKATNYIKYAVGEIALVMIGILLALQVNNWNNDRKRNQLEKVLLNQVKQELSTTYRDLKSDINLLELATRSHFRILDYFEDNVSYADSMCFDFYWLTIDEYIYPNSSIYSRIKEVGLDIIKNDSIKSLLQGMYEMGFPRISKDNAFHPDISDYFSEYYQNHFVPNTDQSLKFKVVFPTDTLQSPVKFNAFGRTRFETHGYVPLDFEALKMDPKFKMLMRNTQKFRSYKLGMYNRSKNGIEKVLSLIDKELTND